MHGEWSRCRCPVRPGDITGCLRETGHTWVCTTRICGKIVCSWILHGILKNPGCMFRTCIVFRRTGFVIYRMICVYVAGECLVKEKKLVREDFAKIRNDLREKMERTAFKDMKNLV